MIFQVVHMGYLEFMWAIEGLQGILQGLYGPFRGSYGPPRDSYGPLGGSYGPLRGSNGPRGCHMSHSGVQMGHSGIHMGHSRFIWVSQGLYRSLRFIWVYMGCSDFTQDTLGFKWAIQEFVWATLVCMGYQLSWMYSSNYI